MDLLFWGCVPLAERADYIRQGNPTLRRLLIVDGPARISRMNFRLLNLFMMIFWLCLGAALLLRDVFLPDRQKHPDMEHRLDLLAWVVLALAAWNLLRWWMVRSALKRREEAEAAYRAHVGPPAPKEAPQITDPQFQFDRPDIPPPPPPNGSGR